MLNRKRKNIVVAMLTLLMAFQVVAVNAESLFKVGVTQSVTPVTPRSWYTGTRAVTVGDVVTILVSEQSNVSNSVNLSSKKSTSTEDNFSGILNKILPGKGIVPDVDGWGSGSDVSNNATLTRSYALTQTITTQVVQVLPNGNLVIQGKKSYINSGDRQDVIISGIVNPRMLDGNSQIPSSRVANLQLAVMGKGTVSRGQSDGMMNKLLRILF